MFICYIGLGPLDLKHLAGFFVLTHSGCGVVSHLSTVDAYSMTFSTRGNPRLCFYPFQVTVNWLGTGIFLPITQRIMSKAEYRRLLKMEIEQLGTCRETSHNRYHEVVDEPIRKLDSDLLIAIARDRIDVGLDLTSEDRKSVESQLLVD